MRHAEEFRERDADRPGGLRADSLFGTGVPRTHAAPNGTTHSLVDAAMRAFAGEGARYLTLTWNNGNGWAGSSVETKPMPSPSPLR